MATNVFNSLPAYVQKRIDRAFDAVGKPCRGAEDAVMGGGFIIESSMGGGFIGDDEEEERDKPTQLSMADIPRALQELDLAPDDEQVLAVFRNAASGWTAASSDEVDEAGGGWVSREDWRSVCAVLLEHYKEEYQDDSDGAPPQQLSDEDAGSDDQYLGSEGEDEEDSDDEYVEAGPSAARRRTRGRAAKSSSDSLAPDPTSSKHELTKRQQETALDAFALFFPDVAEQDLPKQKIMIKDIQRVAKLLGEKIKADEMVEMLDTFSTSPDKSVSLEDFGRIMVAAKLA
ncbi:hypothetical protein LshimejAT787_0604870 [Lyophyllum shimeji]|uniref:EF-hand domain-containing protein n=1 Tax=Lyophyllum shimeji TaxID=47721 RepID=A0A9P3UPR8_LYOSH|nr:hypothetical protein LshimejAT787_0604870 [Lyophyllum shimeji]